jgi:hypothetical protein
VSLLASSPIDLGGTRPRGRRNKDPLFTHVSTKLTPFSVPSFSKTLSSPIPDAARPYTLHSELMLFLAYLITSVLGAPSLPKFLSKPAAIFVGGQRDLSIVTTIHAASTTSGYVCTTSQCLHGYTNSLRESPVALVGYGIIAYCPPPVLFTCRSRCNAFVPSTLSTYTTASWHLLSIDILHTFCVTQCTAIPSYNNLITISDILKLHLCLFLINISTPYPGSKCSAPHIP